MTKLQKSKKGFTLTELAIVIAVIAILIAVLVPTFVSLINKAEESSDSQLVKNLNTALSVDEATDGKAETMSEALEIAAENGYNVDKLTPSSSGDIVWDQESNRFLLIDEEGSISYMDESATTITDSELSTNAYQLWYIAKSESDVAKGKYSYYLDYETTSVTAKYGVDVGENEGVAVTISSSSFASAAGGNEAKSNGVALAAKKLTAGSTSTPAIRINTNGGTLKISSTAVANIEHYGTATTVEVATSSTSYTTYATVTTVTVSENNVEVNVETGASIITVNASTTTSVTVTVSSSAEVSGVVGDSVTVTGSATKYTTTEYASYYASVGGAYYTTLTAAVNAASNGDTVTLLKDISGSLSTIFNNLSTNYKSVTIDLNNNKVTVTNGSCTISNAASITFKNGTLVNNTMATSGALLIAESGASITMQNMYVNATGSILYPKGNASTVSIINSTLYTTGVYCVGTNASEPSYYGIAINIENSTLTSDADNGDDCTVMINVPGTLNIEDSVITGDRQAVLVRAGTATITNTTITCTGDVKGQNSYNNSNWGQGNEVPTGALIIGNQNGTYSGDATVTLKNVTCTLESNGKDSSGNEYTSYTVYMYGGVICYIDDSGNRITSGTDSDRNKAILNYDSACSLGTITKGETTYTEVNKI